MKTIYSIAILFMGLVMVSCNDDEVANGSNRTPQNQKIDSTYIYNDAGVLNLRTIYRYNDKGLLAASYTNRWNGTSWEQNYINEYNYDANDSLTMRVQYNADAKGVPVDGLTQTKREFVRDSKGKLQSEAMYLKYSNDSEWEPDNYKIEYTYNKDGLLISYLYYDCLIPYRTWQMRRKFEYTYENGLMKTGTLYYWSNVEWYVNSNYTYEYESNGRLKSRVSDFFGTKDRIEYTYNAAGNYSLVTYSKYDGSDWFVNGKDEYVYDDKGHLIRKTYISLKDDELRPYGKYELEYNAEGCLTKSTYYDYKAGIWEINTSEVNYYSI